MEYVNDPTNFQPEITLRNAIRQMLSEQNDPPNVIQVRDIDVECIIFTVTFPVASSNTQGVAS